MKNFGLKKIGPPEEVKPVQLDRDLIYSACLLVWCLFMSVILAELVKALPAYFWNIIGIVAYCQLDALTFKKAKKLLNLILSFTLIWAKILMYFGLIGGVLLIIFIVIYRNFFFGQ